MSTNPIHFCGESILLYQVKPLALNFVDDPFALPEATQEELAAIEKNLGSEPTSLDTTTIPQIQAHRNFSITLLVTSVLSSIALITLGIASGILPLLLAGGGALTLLGGGAAIYVSHSCNLTPTIEHFNDLKFHQILERFTPAQIIAADALGSRLKEASHQAKVQAYWNFTQLANHSAHLMLQKGARIGEIERIFNQAMSELDRWHEGNQRLAASHLLHEVQVKAQLDRHYTDQKRDLEGWLYHETVKVEEKAHAAIKALATIFEDLLIPPVRSSPLDIPPNERYRLSNHRSTNMQLLEAAIGQVSQYPVFHGKEEDWSDIVDGMGERFFKFPRLVLLELLQTATPERIHETLYFSQLDAQDAVSISMIKTLQDTLFTLNATENQHLASRLYSGDDKYVCNTTNKLFLDICQWTAPFATLASFNNAINSCLSSYNV